MNEDLTVAGLGKAAGVFQLTETDLYIPIMVVVTKTTPCVKTHRTG